MGRRGLLRYQIGFKGRDVEQRLKHQLLVHLDYSPPPIRLDVRFSYPFSGDHVLREQVLSFDQASIPTHLRTDLDAIVRFLLCRIPRPADVRLPHAKVTPTIERAVLTVVAQDQNRAVVVPLARMYYRETVHELGSMNEKQIRVERPDLSADELRLAKRVAAAARRIAWQAYSRTMAAHLFSSGAA
jgi:hypothetical protein